MVGVGRIWGGNTCSHAVRPKIGRRKNNNKITK
jgi:hypothetical protein